MPPTFADSKNLGAGLSVPYFWAINDDKNLTVTSKLFADEHPLIIGEYHQAFKNSSFLADFGYTKGYKKTSSSKKAGDKSHIFQNLLKILKAKQALKILLISKFKMFQMINI